MALHSKIKPREQTMNDEPILSGRMMFYGDAAFLASTAKVTLKTSPDLQLLQEAVNGAAKQHPWVTYGVREEGGLFYYSDNLSHAITIAEWNDDEPPVLGGKESDGHLLGVYYQGRDIRFCIFHGLTDGDGLLTFVNATMSRYAALLRGEPIALESASYPDAEAEPLVAIDQALREAGIPWDPQAMSGGLPKEGYAAHEHLADVKEGSRTFFVSADAAGLVGFAKERGVKVSAALVSLYAGAVRKVHPDARRMRVAMPVNFRTALGIPHTFRNCAMPPAMYDIELGEGDGVNEIAGQVNQTILKVTSPVAKLYTVKGFATHMDMLPPMPYAQTEMVMAQSMSVDRPPFTFNCSYAGRYSDEGYLELIDHVYCMTPAYGSAPVLVVIAMPDRFFITINQGGSANVYVQAYLDVLQENGIDARLDATEPGARQYVALRETLGLR